jgi:hypothetical protein
MVRLIITVWFERALSMKNLVRGSISADNPTLSYPNGKRLGILERKTRGKSGGPIR